MTVREAKLPWQQRGFWWRLALYAVLSGLVLVILFPVLWMLSSSLKPERELFARDLTLLPVEWTLASYISVWQGTSFPNYFVNSFKIAALSTLFSRSASACMQPMRLRALTFGVATRLACCCWWRRCFRRSCW